MVDHSKTYYLFRYRRTKTGKIVLRTRSEKFIRTSLHLRRFACVWQGCRQRATFCIPIRGHMVRDTLCTDHAYEAMIKVESIWEKKEIEQEMAVLN